MTLTGGDGASMSRLAELGPQGFGNLLTPISESVLLSSKYAKSATDSIPQAFDNKSHFFPFY